MKTPNRPDEFGIIEKYFRPLSGGFPGSLDLRDDAALLDLLPTEELVVTMDTLIAGVHFLPNADPSAIAWKALAVNLSDLAAMGAKPHSYTLALTLSPACTEPWIASFVSGLDMLQRRVGIILIGGDTTKGPGPVSISITAFGKIAKRSAISRSGANPGDRILVSGVIGDAYLGLKVAQGTLIDPSETWQKAYERPEPRNPLGQMLVGMASSMADVSDGLLADLGHISKASQQKFLIQAGDIPLSDPTRAWVGDDPERLLSIITGGDDYELIFTASQDQIDAIETKAKSLGIAVTDIGEVLMGEGVSLIAADGEQIETKGAGGYTHF